MSFPAIQQSAKPNLKISQNLISMLLKITTGIADLKSAILEAITYIEPSKFLCRKLKCFGLLEDIL